MVGYAVDFQDADFFESPFGDLTGEILIDVLDALAIGPFDGGAEPFILKHFEGTKYCEAGRVACLHS